MSIFEKYDTESSSSSYDILETLTYHFLKKFKSTITQESVKKEVLIDKPNYSQNK